MSLACLAELVLVTSEAVRSLNNNNKLEANNTSNIVHMFNAGSPFESPRSFQSVSVKSGNCNEVELENSQPSPKPASDELAEETNKIVDSENNINLLGVNGDVSVIEMTRRSSETQHSGKYNNNVNNNDRKLSISKTRLREIPSPIEQTHDPYSPRSQDNVSSARSDIYGQHKDALFPEVASSNEKVFVERHEPNAKNFNNNKLLVNEIDVKQSINLFSSSGEQPEIIDVHQRVATITSGMSQSSDDSAEVLHCDAHKPSGSGPSRIYGNNPVQPGKNELGHGLKQGALNSGIVDPTRVSLFNDVYISHFGLTEKQRGLKEALANRSEGNRPKKKFVQPQIIRKKLSSDSDTDRSKNNHPVTAQTVGSAADSAVTAAAAASAAVAAAQPFLKTQHELETHLQQLLAQISELQQKANIAGAVDKSTESENRIKDLEKQVAELNERRFEHLENLQQQQMQLQAQLLFMSQLKNHNSRGHTSRPFQISRIPQAAVRRPDMAPHQTEFTSYHPTAQSQPKYQPSTLNQPVYNTGTHTQPAVNPDIASKHNNYLNEVRELQGSHLDTPAPRDRVPKPAPYILPYEPTKNFGFLQNLLARKDNADKDTTYSVMGDYSSPVRQDSDRPETLIHFNVLSFGTAHTSPNVLSFGTAHTSPNVLSFGTAHTSPNVLSFGTAHTSPNVLSFGTAHTSPNVLSFGTAHTSPNVLSFGTAHTSPNVLSFGTAHTSPNVLSFGTAHTSPNVLSFGTAHTSPNVLSFGTAHTSPNVLSFGTAHTSPNVLSFGTAHTSPNVLSFGTAHTSPNVLSFGTAHTSPNVLSFGTAHTSPNVLSFGTAHTSPNVLSFGTAHTSPNVLSFGTAHTSPNVLSFGTAHTSPNVLSFGTAHTSPNVLSFGTAHTSPNVLSFGTAHTSPNVLSFGTAHTSPNVLSFGTAHTSPNVLSFGTAHTSPNVPSIVGSIAERPHTSLVIEYS